MKKENEKDKLNESQEFRGTDGEKGRGREKERKRDRENGNGGLKDDLRSDQNLLEVYRHSNVSRRLATVITIVVNDKMQKNVSI